MLALVLHTGMDVKFCILQPLEGAKVTFPSSLIQLFCRTLCACACVCDFSFSPVLPTVTVSCRCLSLSFLQECVSEAAGPVGEGEGGRALPGGDPGRGLGPEREAAAADGQRRRDAANRKGQTESPERGHVP